MLSLVSPMTERMLTMSEQTIEKIKEKYMPVEYDFNLNKHDIDWLIEEVGNLTTDNEALLSLESICRKRAMQLHHENKIHRARIHELFSILESEKEYTQFHY